ncbi:MAG: GAF domain-containing protein [Myxococcales bacterium]|nr:GAF domain-containing protein [Myxococcales bacterium]
MGDEFAEQRLAPAALEKLMSTLALAKRGDFSVRMPATGHGVTREVADDLNSLLEMQERVVAELKRLHEAVARGDLHDRATLQDCDGGWNDQLREANAIVALFSRHCAELRRVAKALVGGDFKRGMSMGEDSIHRGAELLKTAEEVNGLIRHLDTVVNEMTSVVAGVGLDGKLNGQVKIPDAMGSWGLLVGSLNAMTASLSEQVLDLTDTAREFSRGNLEARASVVSRGDMHDLKQALNRTGERVHDLCVELSRVSTELGQDGRLGGQVRLGDAAGDMRRAIEATNEMLATFSRELQALCDGAAYLAEPGEEALAFEGDAHGAFSEARANMLAAVAKADRIRGILDGLASNEFPEIETGAGALDMAMFRVGVRLKREWFGASRSALLETRRVAEDLAGFADMALARTAAATGAATAALHVVQDGDRVRMIANLGGPESPDERDPVKLGQGLVGKAAKTGEATILRGLDEHNVRLTTGVVEIVPRALLLFPISGQDGTLAVIELGFVDTSVDSARDLLEYLTQDLADGIREVMQGPAVRGNGNARIRELGEDLAIATARVEQLTRELQQRDRSLREVEQVLETLRSTPVDEAS